MGGRIHAPRHAAKAAPRPRPPRPVCGLRTPGPVAARLHNGSVGNSGHIITQSHRRSSLRVCPYGHSYRDEGICPIYHSLFGRARLFVTPAVHVLKFQLSLGHLRTSRRTAGCDLGNAAGLIHGRQAVERLLSSEA
jgi:hypothetical protein